jgi:predicted regulator of Ras-like GTPase activity (Roadblock/LC7/MglB family)
MGDRPEDQSEFIRQQLEDIAERIPEILWIGLVSANGNDLGHYIKRQYLVDSIEKMAILDKLSESVDSEAIERIATMTAATFSLSEQISEQIGTGEWEFTVLGGKRARAIVLTVNDESALVAIVPRSGSTDTILTELRPSVEKLLGS